ncbi:MAG: isoprenylcysteine carboxylmethyltransferase family protein [Acidobacteriota bacterium]
MAWNPILTPALVGLSWAAYFALHSVLASSRFKRAAFTRWPGLAGGYRLLYNLAAIVALAPPVYLTFATGAPPLWTWDGPAGWVADGLGALGAAGFVATLFAYDLGEFTGLRRGMPKEEREGRRLRISGFHRFVRHPWYAFALVMIWTREMNPAMLTAATVTTAYLVIGSRLEEGRLIEEFGDRYRAYRRAVPGLVPLPWRILSAEQARDFESAP